MNHLLVGKNALVSAKNRQFGGAGSSFVARAKAVAMQNSPRNQIRKQQQNQQHHQQQKQHQQQQQQQQQQRQQQLQKQQQKQQLQHPVTIHWKDMKKKKDEREVPESEFFIIFYLLHFLFY